MNSWILIQRILKVWKTVCDSALVQLFEVNTTSDALYSITFLVHLITLTGDSRTTTKRKQENKQYYFIVANTSDLFLSLLLYTRTVCFYLHQVFPIIFCPSTLVFKYFCGVSGGERRYPDFKTRGPSLRKEAGLSFFAIAVPMSWAWHGLNYLTHVTLAVLSQKGPELAGYM